MRKLIIIGIGLLYAGIISAQKYYTKTGETTFSGSKESFEPVEAINKSTTAILNVETGDVAALVFIRAFKFEIALMEEHFNENYMDTDLYPKAKFKGKISGFNLSALTAKEKEYPLHGTITIKGVEQPIKTLVKLKKVKGEIIARSTFKVKPEDFKIEIPSIVGNKIADEIIIKLNYVLNKK
ncbi:MAG: YceI family protein [Flavobacteriales bacterium]|jgi:hypothetical protein|nr:YceI family protein [Flavobacteriales bacterium]